MPFGRSEPLLCASCKQFRDELVNRPEDATFKETRRMFHPQDADWGTKDFLLHHAAALGHTQCVEDALQPSAETVNTLSRLSNRTALMVAAKHNHMMVVEQLLKAKADVHIEDTLHHSAMYYAAEEGHFWVVHMLLESGAHPNLDRDFDRTAPLVAATWGGHLRAMEELINAGAKFNLFNRNWLWEVFGFAGLSRMSCHTISRMLKMMNDDEGAIPYDLFVGIVAKNMDMLLFNFCMGYYNVKNIDGTPVNFNLPLHLATQHGCDQSVSKLLEHSKELDIDINGLGEDGTKTCLQKACENDSPEVVFELLYRGADVEKIGNNDYPNARPPIFIALRTLSFNGHGLTTLAHLIMHNCDVERKYPMNLRGVDDLVSVTPLDYVLCGNNLYAARMLVLAGAQNYNPAWAMMKPHKRLIHKELECSKKKKDAFVQSELNGPRPLYYICRSAIRKIMNGRYICKIWDLPIPKHVQEFLCYRDIERIAEVFEIKMERVNNSSNDEMEDSESTDSDATGSGSSSDGDSSDDDDDDDDEDEDLLRRRPVTPPGAYDVPNYSSGSEDNDNGWQEDFGFSDFPGDYGICEF